ncbi:MATE family efflux transporter [Sulfitobacter sabulilitoris]|uniref:MATE family efflux transporter n=1 Tax=Sulfitobacter sabulilitoris TaxID=2562655 RepID=A0A5S3QCY3_9RHOB|nr:MATE family efflux transporter [Sulfitobacter sabulilitoris]TMM54982.1 MATE family efflux transporter [Sulfitobacter sabulilitoris]
MADKTSQDLTTGPVWRALATMSAPMSFGIFAVLSVGLADAYFLGQVGGAALAAVGFIYPVTTAVTSLSIGLSAGANAALSQGVGRGDSDDDTRRLGLHAIGLGLILSGLVALGVWAVYPLLFGAMGASGNVMPQIAGYIPVWAVSFPFLVVMMITNSVFRSHGDSLTAAWIMVLAAVVNVGLDPLLIFGLWGLPEMGTQGAATATLIGRVIAVVLALFIAWRRGLLGVCGNVLDGALASARKILSVGLPASFSNAINPAGMALVTAAVATVGETAVAGFGAATRVQSMALVPLLALSAGIGPVVGQNWGAEARSRAQDATQLAFWICLGYGALVALVLGVFAGPIAGLLASGPEDAAFAATYLRWVGATLFGYGIIVVANAAMNARDKALWSMSLSLGRIFVIYLPLAWIGALTLGYPGIIAAAVLANVLAAWGGVVAAKATGLVRLEIALVDGPRKLVQPE